MARKLKRNALSRGTAVYLGGSNVRLVWACGCTRVETLKDPMKRPLGEGGTASLVHNWRQNGVVLEQCKRHPDWYSRDSQIARLNALYAERPKYVCAGVLAGAYATPQDRAAGCTRNIGAKAMRRHVVEVDADGGMLRVLCDGPQLDNMCDDYEDSLSGVTCPSCLKKLQRERRA